MTKQNKSVYDSSCDLFSSETNMFGKFQKCIEVTPVNAWQMAEVPISD